MAIPSSATFAKECVRQALFLGVNPHYLMATAQLRSGIKDDTEGDRVGPFRVTQAVWNAQGSAVDLEVVLESADIGSWRLQVLFAALTALRSQGRLLDELGRLPSAVELYKEQWPGDALDVAKLEAALATTAPFIDPAMEEETGEAQTKDSTVTLEEVDTSVSPSIPDPALPVPKKGEELFVVKAPRVMEKLIADFGLRLFQAAGVLGNIGHECAGFQLMQEVKPIGGGRGGFGWCQWTNTRRNEFEDLCKTRGLNPTSDAANYANLQRELRSTHRSSVDAVKATATLAEAVRVFEQKFERAKAGFEHFDRRERWAQLALDTFEATSNARVPAAIARLLDPDLQYTIFSTAKSGGTTFWIIDQFQHDGGQVLIKQEAGSPPQILAQDTTVLPLDPKFGLSPAVVNALQTGFKSGGDLHPPIASDPVASDDDIARRVFSKAKECDDTLVTRDAPNTSNGKLACAWAVNEVVRRAVGRPVGGGVSTTEMGAVLRKKHRPVAQKDIGPGMIVISPTQGKNVGHVGILGTIAAPVSATRIYSNSSQDRVFSHRFTLGRWQAFYGDNKRLPVLFFALTK